MLQATTDKIFSLVVPRRPQIIKAFKVSYGILGLLLLISGILLAKQFQIIFLYEVATLCGKTALVIFCVTLIPGIVRRFGIKHKLIAIIMIFRRYLGILMYMFALIHISVLKLIPMLLVGKILPFSPFEICGLVAVSILFSLFITSNDVSLKFLKIWWYQLHKLIYIAMWAILLHVGLQEISLYTILMGVVVLLMMLSFLFSYFKKPQI